MPHIIYYSEVLTEIDHKDLNWLILSLEITLKMTEGLSSLNTLLGPPQRNYTMQSNWVVF